MISNNMIKAACAIALIAIIFNLVTISSYTSENETANSGVYKACFKIKINEVCKGYEDKKVFTISIQIYSAATFAIIGLLCSLLGFAFSVMIVLEKKSDYNAYTSVCVALLAAGICLILSILIWFFAVDESPGPHWYLAFIAGILHLVSAGLHSYSYKHY